MHADRDLNFATVIRRFLPVTLAFGVWACGRSVTLSNSDGSVRFVYKCGEIERQVETRPQIQMLVAHARRVAQDAVKNGRISSAQSLQQAMEAADIAYIERAVVEYLCQYPLDPG